MLKDFLKNPLGRIVGRSDNNQRRAADYFTQKNAEAKPARLGPSNDAMDAILGNREKTNILWPLFATKGIQFPYTPDIVFGGQAEYQDFHFTHSNFAYQQYNKSMPLEIQVSGTFTCQTNDEGRYLIAALRFLRSMTMMEFGTISPQKAGTPPPVLRFNYLGEYMFSNVPVVVSNFSFTLPRDVDYVGIRYPGGMDLRADANDQMNENPLKGAKPKRPLIIGGPDQPITYMPTRMELTVQLKVQQNPKHVREQFDLDLFKRGGLIKKGFI
jgi:hypothetical protein